MTPTQLLTIIIPVFNRAHVLQRTLDSIASQSCTDFRIIIVDNNSSDNSREIAELWAENNADRLSIEVVSENRQGATFARNCGLSLAQTEYVMFFDSDDEMRPDHISLVNEHLTRRPDTDILRWDVTIIDDDGWTQNLSPRFHDELQLHLFHSTLSTQRMAVRRSLINQVGGWNEELTTWDDLELGVRLLLTDCKVDRLNCDPKVVIHPSEVSISGVTFSDRYREREQALDAIERILRNADKTDELFLLDCRRMILAAMYLREGLKDQGNKLKNSTAARYGFRKSQILGAVFLTSRLVGRGGSTVALYLAGKKQPHC
ncbi:MAG: glycosyltransferase family 2 protein [Bacteroides sp.]|nr:glycosyltransferase family 2 protein [Bacteroides sp.]MCM1414249.1 glycosyltransferase family 2 protein [Bacteroides sp.]MCM1471216.1 glycosyltransferase family 2 protein [Bacteroides sp.]